MGKPKHTINQVKEALQKNGGFVTQAAKELGITPQAIYYRLEKNQSLRKALEDVRSEYLDMAEFKLIQKVKEGNLGAICFYLKCQGKERGYIERQEITGKDGSDLEKKVIVEFVGPGEPQIALPEEVIDG